MTDTETILPTREEAEAWLERRKTVTTAAETVILLDDAVALIERIVALHERGGSMWKPGEAGLRPLGPEPKIGKDDTLLTMIYDEGRDVAAITGDGRVLYAAEGVAHTRVKIKPAERFEDDRTDAGLDRTTFAVNDAHEQTGLGLEHVW